MHEPPPTPTARGRLRWLGSAGLGLIVLSAYLLNGREIGTYDTEPTALLPFAILRGDGPFLDRFAPLLEGPGGRLPEFAARSRGHIVSLYPIGPAVVAVPIEWPLLARLDWSRPGWDRSLPLAYAGAKAMSKVAAAVIAALTVVAFERLLLALGLARVAWVAALSLGLASNLWAVASQALWQHGPAALGLTLTMLLLHRRPASPARLLLAGITSAAMVACRSIDLIFAATVVLWLARHQPRGLAWFLPGPVAIGGALLAYNGAFFGAIEGGQAVLESLHPRLHGVAGPWSGDVAEGSLGTLFSPSRGLFVFTPWIAVALAALPWYADRLRPWSLGRWLLASLLPYHLVLTRYAVWWGGHCFGPRYWTDALPLFAALLGFGLDWSRERFRPLVLLFACTIVWGFGVQLIGASLYPSGWNLSPNNIDTHHDRLWDWSDSELTRCLVGALKIRGR